jgi:deoxyribodipyrimidine photo-lyase
MHALEQPPLAHADFALTRDHALHRLQEFVPAAGPEYARLRNFDLGAGHHTHVSRLSAALRRRLICEAEVVAAVGARHGIVQAEKFISEIFWRTYRKGWLEQRPTVWSGYLNELDRARGKRDRDNSMCQMHDSACAGLSGIDCFDAWAVELKDTGYLHNWARMQFASIWMSTLGLPWELGADFMFSHLVDADPASNTLSWRLVTGLHTKGKAYLADADRIRAMTNGRFSREGLARKAVIPADGMVVPPASPLRDFTRPDKSRAAMMLITIEDLSLETLPEIHEITIKAIAVLPAEHERDRLALNDALRRAAKTWPHAAVLGSPEEDGFRAAKAGLRSGHYRLCACRSNSSKDRYATANGCRPRNAVGRTLAKLGSKGMALLQQRIQRPQTENSIFDQHREANAMSKQLVVWFDSNCPLCRREIALLRWLDDRRNVILFVDACDPSTSCPIDRAEILSRFHAQEEGRLLSGAAAFAAMWRAIPVLRPIGLLADWPPVTPLFEAGYRGFLRIRPHLQRIFR